MAGEPVTALATSNLSIVSTTLPSILPQELRLSPVNSNIRHSCQRCLAESRRSWRNLLGWSLAYKLNANKTEEPGEVIAELDQIFYKNVCAEQREEGQSNDVSGNSN